MAISNDIWRRIRIIPYLLEETKRMIWWVEFCDGTRIGYVIETNADTRQKGGRKYKGSISFRRVTDKDYEGVSWMKDDPLELVTMLVELYVKEHPMA